MYAKLSPAVGAILDFISKYESGGNYLAVFGNARSTKPLPPTVGAVMLYQHDLRVSTALGRYQILLKTLQALTSKYNIHGDEPFTPDLQDELAYYLLLGRGLDRWVSGTLSDSSFADQLSMEWASMPYHSGKSYYDGDGLNHSLVSRTEFMTMLANAKENPATVSAPPVQATPQAQGGTMANPLSGLIEFGENIGKQIESAVAVVSSPNNNISTTSLPGVPRTGLFKDISDAQAAVTALNTLVADVKGGKFSNTPQDVYNFMIDIMTILEDFSISVPGLTVLQTILPKLAPVVAAL